MGENRKRKSGNKPIYFHLINVCLRQTFLDFEKDMLVISKESVQCINYTGRGKSKVVLIESDIIMIIPSSP